MTNMALYPFWILIECIWIWTCQDKSLTCRETEIVLENLADENKADTLSVKAW